MNGKVRLEELGFNPAVNWFVSPHGNEYQLYFNASTAYDEVSDCFRLLQSTGLRGGCNARWVKAKTLRRRWKQEAY